MNNNKPKFFIVGAPKCGTTALAKYLSEHRNIFFSPLKEPNYFATNYGKQDFHHLTTLYKLAAIYLQKQEFEKAWRILEEGLSVSTYSKINKNNIAEWARNIDVSKIPNGSPAEARYYLEYYLIAYLKMTKPK